MFVLRIEHPVPDYDAWKAAFDRDPLDRRRCGVRRYHVLRPSDDPLFVAVDLEFAMLDAAEAMHARLRELWGRVEGDVITAARARIFAIEEHQEY